MITTEDAQSMLSAIRAVHPFVQTSPDAAEVWRDLLGDVRIDAVRQALRVVLQESSKQPTPADVLRVIRLQRFKETPEPLEDVLRRLNIPPSQN